MKLLILEEGESFQRDVIGKNRPHLIGNDICYYLLNAVAKRDRVIFIIGGWDIRFRDKSDEGRCDGCRYMSIDSGVLNNLQQI